LEANVGEGDGIDVGVSVGAGVSVGGTSVSVGGEVGVAAIATAEGTLTVGATAGVGLHAITNRSANERANSRKCKFERFIGDLHLLNSLWNGDKSREQAFS
jgi:hypothetical protein